MAEQATETQLLKAKIDKQRAIEGFFKSLRDLVIDVRDLVREKKGAL